MAIKNKPRGRKPVIDLTGPGGNAFAIMAAARNLCRDLNRQGVEKDWPSILERMKSSDYENLIKVFDEEFGDYVDLER